MSGAVGPAGADMALSGPELGKAVPGLPASLPLRETSTSVHLDLGAGSGAAIGGRRYLSLRPSDFVTQVRSGRGEDGRCGGGPLPGDVTADDVAKAGAAMRGAAAIRTKAVAKELGESALRTETVDVWVGTSGPRSGRPVRVDLALSTDSAITVDSIHYSAYEAAPVRVVVPPATQRMSTAQTDKLGDGDGDGGDSDGDGDGDGDAA